MKKNKKRMLSILLACVFVFGLIPGYALAADEENTPEVLTIQSAEDLPEFESYFQGTEETENEALTDPSAPTSGVCGENVSWTLENGVLTISGSGAMRNYVEIPWYYFDCTGEELEQFKSQYNNGLAESDFVPWYKSTAAVKKIVIENGVTSIGNYAFYRCENASSVVIPDGLIRIGDGSFQRTAISDIEIPDGVRQIGVSAFSGSRLTKIALPDSVTLIEDYAFALSDLADITIPSKVKIIGNCAFAYCSFSSISIPDSVTKIGWEAFRNCNNLTQVKMSANVAEIQYAAFAGCSNLHSIELPETIRRIGSGAFGYSYVTGVGPWPSETHVALWQKYDDFTIFGYSNTAAESYASEHEFTFVPLGTADCSSEINPFVDVNETDDFYEAVFWAYNHDPQITNGIDATHFGPGTTVTRGQAVTFLWRAMGEPEPIEEITPFVDLKDDYYKKAVAWAVENGITNGVDATHFDPDGKLSTAHMITFLYRTVNHCSDGWSEDENGPAAWWARGYGYLDAVNIVYSTHTLCPREKVVMLLYQAI